MKRALDFIAELFFPPACIACKTLLDRREESTPCTIFCNTCLENWENERLDTCGICGRRVTECACLTKGMEAAHCAAFRKLIYYRHGKVAAVQNRLIFHLKHHCVTQTPRFLAAQLLPTLQEMLEADGAQPSQAVLTYVPRSRRARRENGADQAELLAKALSEVSKIEVRRLIFRNRGQNKPQKSLTPTARMQNAKQAFGIAKDAAIKGKTVFLIDDIVTTGASMAACTVLLRRAGAKAVYCLAVASDDVNQSRV